MVEFSKVKTRELLDLLKAVHESISVYEKLSRSFRNVQVVLKELLYSKERFVVERLYAAFLEHLFEESFAEGGGQVVYQPCYTEVVVRNYHLIGVEYLADFERGLRFLKAARKISYAFYYRAYADVHA